MGCKIGAQVRKCWPSGHVRQVYKQAVLERWDPHQSLIYHSSKLTTTISLHSISTLDMRSSAFLVTLFALSE